MKMSNLSLWNSFAMSLHKHRFLEPDPEPPNVGICRYCGEPVYQSDIDNHFAEWDGAEGVINDGACIHLLSVQRAQ